MIINMDEKKILFGCKYRKKFISLISRDYCVGSFRVNLDGVNDDILRLMPFLLSSCSVDVFFLSALEIILKMVLILKRFVSALTIVNTNRN